jgi:hypothetical protein
MAALRIIKHTNHYPKNQERPFPPSALAARMYVG